MRLIDKDALIDWLTRPTGFRSNCEDCFSTDCVDCVRDEAVENAPEFSKYTILREFVDIGEWVKVNDTAPRYKCSNCQHLFNNKSYSYCPNCGAKMDNK